MATEEQKKWNQQGFKDIVYLLRDKSSWFWKDLPELVAAKVLNTRLAWYDPASGKQHQTKTTSLASMAGWADATSYVAAQEGAATRALVEEMARRQGISNEEIKTLLASASSPRVTGTYELRRVEDSDVTAQLTPEENRT